MLRLTALLLCLASVASVRAQARVETAPEEGEPRIALSLVADREGDMLRVGVHFEPDPDWHVYWRNPGQSGVSTEVELEGLPVGELRWPTPERFEAPGPIVTYGYHEVVLFAEAPAPAAPVEITAVADFLVCKIDCIPGRVTLRDMVAPNASSAALRRSAANLPIDPSAAMVQLSLDGRWPEAGRTTHANLRVLCPAAAGEGCSMVRVDPDAFFPERTTGLEVQPESWQDEERGGRLRLRLRATGRHQVDSLRGVVVLSRDGRPVPVAFDVPMSASATPGTMAPSAPGLGLGLALLFAFLGGLILNLMPCVLPVLTVKVLGVLRLGGDSTNARRHGWAYAFGIIGSMLLLAAVVLTFRASGQGLGWGFHLQEPRFVALLAALLVVLALGLFGVFHLRLGSAALEQRVDASHGLARSVGEGVLAVIVATPCTAPFLGSAVGFALTQSTGVVLAIFALVGAGLAAPFVLLVHVPALIERIPKPGPWMEVVERLLGFALLGTAAWLVWIYGQTTGVNGIGVLLGFLLAVALSVWALARRRTPATVGLAVALLAGGVSAVWIQQPTEGVEAHDGWRAWAPDEVQAELDAGRTAVVVFTADWCVTCKVNERFVLGSDEVREELDGVATFMADWTRRDERIRAELARHGRAGVPLTLIYRPQAPHTPEVLPELLTKETVLEALRRSS